MTSEVKVPTVGESINEGTLVAWLKADGEYVGVDEDLFELETDKITMNVTAEAAGRLTVGVKEGETVTVGQVVGSIDTTAKPETVEATPTPPTDKQPEQKKQPEPVKSTIIEDPPISPPAGKPQMEEKLSQPFDESTLSPAVRKLVIENKLDPRFIPATGKGGRLTKEDVVHYMADNGRETPSTLPSPQVDTKPEPQPDPATRQTRKPMTRLRQRIAEHLIHAQQTAAILTTFNEADMSRVMALRKQFGEQFAEKHGIRLGMMSFFVKASVEALKAVPVINAQIDGNDIVMNHFFDIGVAVSSPKGLVVPVVRDADKLSFAEIEKQIAELAEKAQNRSLTLDDLSGGVFTVSNGGIFGSLNSTPILNSPQSAILGMHTIKKRPIVVGDDDGVEVRPMMYLAVSYDHRLIDGHEAVTFLKTIVNCIEQPERILFDL